jgi:hypothetical protein
MIAGLTDRKTLPGRASTVKKKWNRISWMAGNSVPGLLSQMALETGREASNQK